MASKDIMEAGGKTSEIVIDQKGVAGNQLTYAQVDSWRLGYNGIMTVKVGNVTEIHAEDTWDHIKATK